MKEGYRVHKQEVGKEEITILITESKKDAIARKNEINGIKENDSMTAWVTSEDFTLDILSEHSKNEKDEWSDDDDEVLQWCIITIERMDEDIRDMIARRFTSRGLIVTIDGMGDNDFAVEFIKYSGSYKEWKTKVNRIVGGLRKSFG